MLPGCCIDIRTFVATASLTQGITALATAAEVEASNLLVPVTGLGLEALCGLRSLGWPEGPASPQDTDRSWDTIVMKPRTFPGRHVVVKPWIVLAIVFTDPRVMACLPTPFTRNLVCEAITSRMIIFSFTPTGFTGIPGLGTTPIL